MTLLPYATVKPHDAAACRQNLCGPRGRGHWACQNPACPGRSDNNGAGRIATLQARRHATPEEYAALPLAHTPIDGIAHKALFMCDECAETTEAHLPFCTHPAPTLPACPTCAAGADQECVKKDGVTNLGFTHADRPPLVYEHCAHAHRAECNPFDTCHCTGDDSPPIRPPHPARQHIDGPGPDISRVLEPDTTIPLAQALLQHHGVHWWQVRELASCLTQDNQPALRADIAQLDAAGHLQHDDHGHEIVATVVIPIEAAARGQWQMPGPDDAAPMEQPPQG